MSALTNKIVVSILLVSLVFQSRAYFRLGKKEMDSHLKSKLNMEARERRMMRLLDMLDTENVKFETGRVLACVEYPKQCERR